MEAIGRYRVEAEAGRGGAGSVYRCASPDGHPVAVKLLTAGRGATPRQLARFDREARALLKLRHPGVVALLDAGKHEGAPYLVLEWVEGETLGARLARRGALAVDEALELVGSLAEALAHCHAQGVLHRDLKPDNVLLRADTGQPCLTDFGLARELEPGGKDLTTTGAWLGTPGWWPPEQARGELDRIGPASDVYGLGGLLYAALTGVGPQAGRDMQHLLRAFERPPPPPSQHRPEVPGWVDALCLRALDPDPARRPPDAAAFAALLTAGPRRGAGARWLVAGALALGASAAAIAWSRREPAPLPGPAPSPVTPAPPPGPPPDDPLRRVEQVEGLLRDGWRLAQAGDFRGALLPLDQALALAPDHIMGLTRRGAVLVRAGEPERALRDLDRALALDPRNGHALYYRAYALELLGREVEALQAYDRVLEQDPNDAIALSARSNLRSLRGDFEGALQDARRARELAPERVELAVNLGSLLLQIGQPEAALPELDRAVELDPRATRAWSLRGAVRARLGQLPEAVQDFDRALEIDPDELPARVERGKLRLALGDPGGALGDLDRALAREPALADALASRGTALARLGRAREALADWDRALELQPGASWAGEVQREREALLQRQAGR